MLSIKRDKRIAILVMRNLGRKWFFSNAFDNMVAYMYENY